MTSLSSWYRLFRDVAGSPLFIDSVKGVVEAAVVTIICTAILEIWSLDKVKAIIKQPGGGIALYCTAIGLNILNHFIFGVPVYVTAMILFGRDYYDNGNADDKDGTDIVTMKLTMHQICSTLSIVIIHSIGYYTAHRAMHTTPSLYRYHRFHHRFNVHVSPVVANAVTPVEYLVAYVIPFAVGTIIVNPDEISLRMSVYIVSLTNLLIHTPKLESIAQRFVPSYFVSTHDHLEHHKNLSIKNYAAPTINVDWFVDEFEKLFYNVESSKAKLA